MSRSVTPRSRPEVAGYRQRLEADRSGGTCQEGLPVTAKGLDSPQGILGERIKMIEAVAFQLRATHLSP